MDTKKQDTDTGKNDGKAQRQESDGQNMVAKFPQSPTHTSIAAGSTKPLSIQEALSLIQTLAVDLRTLKCEVAILARDNRVWIGVTPPASIGKINFLNGHITISDVPVSEA